MIIKKGRLMNYKALEFERRGAIGMLTLNRPERLNALSLELVGELRSVFGSLRDDLQTRVVIIQGKGRAFCAGADLKRRAEEASSEDEVGEIQRHYQLIQQSFADIVVCMRCAPQPIIAAIRGPAAGAGFSIAMACDVRIAGESARFNAAFIKVGLSGGDCGSSYFLPRLIGSSRAAEYLLTGRFMDALTAERFGLVSRVVPDSQVEATALELAEEMLLTSPLGLRMTKEILNQNIDAPSLGSALHLENRTQTLCVQTEDFKEGLNAFLEKRPPTYHDR